MAKYLSKTNNKASKVINLIYKLGTSVKRDGVKSYKFGNFYNLSNYTHNEIVLMYSQHKPNREKVREFQNLYRLCTKNFEFGSATYMELLTHKKTSRKTKDLIIELMLAVDELCIELDNYLEGTHERHS